MADVGVDEKRRLGRGTRFLIWLLVILVVVALVLVFLMFGPPRLAETFAEPEFCGETCHEMEYVYTSFLDEEHADLETCNDCHLPNNSGAAGFVEHYAWEGVVGVRDLVKHGVGAIPEDIEIKERSEAWTLDNCNRCHDDEIDDDHGDGRDFCWECHDDVFHDVD